MRAAIPLLAVLELLPAVALAGPYSSPFQLRSAVPGTSIKTDTAIASAENGSTVVSFLSASVKVLPEVATSVRVGFASMSPANGPGSPAFMNPQVGVLWSPKIRDDLRISPCFSITLPVGMGGGESPDAAVTASLGGAKQARFMLDSSIASPNHLGLGLGLSVAWFDHGLTLQADANVNQSFQTRGPESVDDAITNSIAGLFAGYAILPQLSVGAELRYQRYLTTPASVAKNAQLRDQASFAVGARGTFDLEAFKLKPGVSYGHAIGGAMGAGDTNVVLLDLAFAL